jgi:hypothetical protein
MANCLSIQPTKSATAMARMNRNKLYAIWLRRPFRNGWGLRAAFEVSRLRARMGPLVVTAIVEPPVTTRRQLRHWLGVAEGTKTSRPLIFRSGAVSVVKSGTEIAAVTGPGSMFGELSALLDPAA